MGKLFETLKAEPFFRGELERVFKKYGIGTDYTYGKDGSLKWELSLNGQDAISELKTVIYNAAHHCYTCGEPRSGDCFTCERLWSS